jgi:tRNA nucleotidyltransferase (CCA-adding enzyme)
MAFRDPIALGDLAITGDDLRAAGLRPGPQLGRILQLLLAQVLVDPTFNTHDDLLRMARQLAEES